MPELPEVETVVRALRAPLIGRTFSKFISYWPRQVVKPDDIRELEMRLNGRTVTAIHRRAKYIVITLDDGAGYVGRKLTILQETQTDGYGIAECDEGYGPYD